MQQSFPTSRKLALRITAAVVSALVILAWAYICANQPNCPQCRNADNVMFTWKSYQTVEPARHEFTRLGPVGYCYHYQDPSGKSKDKSHFGWFCLKCGKHIIRAPNWRSANEAE